MPPPTLGPATPGSKPASLAGLGVVETTPLPALHAPAEAALPVTSTAPLPPLPPRPPQVATGASGGLTTSSDASESDRLEEEEAGLVAGGVGGGFPSAQQQPSSSALLPKHTRVLVSGNARTRASLVGLEGRVRRSVGLGGWHLLVLSTGEVVRLQRNALTVLAPPTGDETDSSDDDCDGGVSAAEASILPRTRTRRPPRPHAPFSAGGLLGVAVGGVAKVASATGGWGAATPSGGSSGAATSTSWLGGGMVGTAAAAAAPVRAPTTTAATTPWLARRLAGPSARRYAAHFGLADASPAALTAHWTGLAVLDERAVAAAFVRAAGRRAAGA